jgi:hypothetical protein
MPAAATMQSIGCPLCNLHFPEEKTALKHIHEEHPKCKQSKERFVGLADYKIIDKSQSIAIVASVMFTFRILNSTSLMHEVLCMRLHITAVTAVESTPTKKH